MAIWYTIEHTKESINNFMEFNYHFHDFSIEKVTYIPDENIAELFLKYDELKDSIILRFINVRGMNVSVKVDCGYADEIMGSVLLLTDNNQFLWIDGDVWGEQSEQHIEELKKECSWIQAENIIWALTDENGNPTEMPPYKIDQTWNIYGKIEHRHFDLIPYIKNK